MTMLYQNIEVEAERLNSILDLIRLGASYFSSNELYFGHGTDNGWDEALNLVLSTLHLELDSEVHILSARVTKSEKTLILDRMKKRVIDKIPVAYLVKTAWFGGYDFYVDERVIVPKSPIAELIDEEFAPWIEVENVKKILDLCTGSGCIAAVCAMAFEDVEVVATDLSEDALAVAKINLERHGLEDTVKLIKSDVFSNVPKAKYDIIVSNPPYVSEAEYSSLPKEYTCEPKMALLAGSDGLDIVKKILEQAKDYLSDNGILIVEVGSAQAALEEMYPEVPFTWLQFNNGGDGVFVLTAKEVKEYSRHFSQEAVK